MNNQAIRYLHALVFKPVLVGAMDYFSSFIRITQLVQSLFTVLKET